MTDRSSPRSPIREVPKLLGAGISGLTWGLRDAPVPKSLSHVWATARDEINRPDLRFHDLRHTGLTWSAATGASTAELMRRAGHSSAQAALRYQHATEDRDRVLADALGTLATAFKIDLIKPDTDTLRTAPPDTAKA